MLSKKFKRSSPAISLPVLVFEIDNNNAESSQKFDHIPNDERDVLDRDPINKPQRADGENGEEGEDRNILHAFRFDRLHRLEERIKFQKRGNNKNDFQKRKFHK